MRPMVTLALVVSGLLFGTLVGAGDYTIRLELDDPLTAVDGDTFIADIFLDSGDGGEAVGLGAALRRVELSDGSAAEKRKAPQQRIRHRGRELPLPDQGPWGTPVNSTREDCALALLSHAATFPQTDAQSGLAMPTQRRSPSRCGRDISEC